MLSWKGFRVKVLDHGDNLCNMSPEPSLSLKRLIRIKMCIISKINLTPYYPAGITLQFDYIGKKTYISPDLIYFKMHILGAS